MCAIEPQYIAKAMENMVILKFQAWMASGMGGFFGPSAPLKSSAWVFKVIGYCLPMNLFFQKDGLYKGELAFCCPPSK